MQQLVIAFAGGFKIYWIVHAPSRSPRVFFAKFGKDVFRDLGAILRDDVRVTFLDLRDDRVPALFDIRKRGIARALESALWLRRALGQLPREPDETVAFEGLGMRERLITGRWPVVAMRRTGKIYETYARFFAERRIPNREVRVPRSKGPARTVGRHHAQSRIAC